ncbi:hypothetical protein DRN69_00310 [Candidatus Pacearchaeota archaeon]|nr:MAG: hypothetical protein DRN69_00310 [Candidatus Pacearchaeota archaeon]
MACGLILITNASKEICEEFARNLEKESKNYSINIFGKKLDIGITGGMKIKVISEEKKRGILIRLERPLDLMLLGVVGNVTMKVFKEWVKNNYGIDVKVKVLTLARVK